MSYLSERVSFLQGLMEGMEISDETKEGKILLSMMDVLNDIADSIDELEEKQAELEEYIEDVDEDLGDLEAEYYGEDDDDFVEIECPNCGETVYFDTETFEDKDELICPNCNEPVFEDGDGEE